MTIHRSHIGASIAAAFAFSSLASAAFAATEIAGDAKSVSIRLENASIDEALKSLGNSFDFHYRAPGALTKSVSGTYRGPLREVVRNLLSGYDFVLTTRGPTIEVSVLGKSSKSADVVVDRKSTASKSAVSVQAPAPAPATANVQNMASNNSRADVQASMVADADVPRPILLAQNDPSKMPMPMPTPNQQDAPMPMPTPQAGGDAPMPIPDTSGNAPMPIPQPNADGPMPTLIPPAADAQPPMPQGQPAPPIIAPKPN